MRQPDEDTSARCAMQKLSNCTTCLEKFRTAIRSLLDDIHIAEGNGESSQKMTLWAQGRYTIDGIREELRRHIDDADIFLSGDVFDTLDAQKKGDYFDVMNRISTGNDKLAKQYEYYTLLGDIEYAERTITDFSRMLKRSYHYITYRKGVGALKNRGLSIHRKKVKNLEGYIKTEAKKLVLKIEQVIAHPLFREMSRKKRNYYNEKWKQYQDEARKTDSI